MATTGGKGKKKKGKTLDLNSFLNDGGNGAAPGYALANTTSWAEQLEEDSEIPSFSSYGNNSNKQIYLPTAPKAARAPDVDMSKIPPQGPFKAFLANVPYDVDIADIEEFFSQLNVREVKLPREGGGDNGRLKGFAYVEFEDKNSLVEALSLSNESIKNRPIRIDIAGTSQDSDRERGNKYDDRPDRTLDDWRTTPREEQPRENYGSREGGFERSSYGDRFSGRDNNERESFPKNSRDRDGQDRESGFRQSDRYERAPDRFDRGPDRGPDRFDRGPDRAPDRFDRGPDRAPDRFDRGPERGPDRFDRGPDRFDRGPDRFDRGSDRNDRGFDRYERAPDRYERRPDRYERSGPGSDFRDDRGYGRRDQHEEKRFSNRDFGPPAAGAGAGAGTDDNARERPRLQLQKRTVPVTGKTETTSTSSIFGGAKPVDTASKEREVEEKLARVHMDKERKISESSDDKGKYDGYRKNEKSRDGSRSSSRSSGGKPRQDSEKSLEPSEETQSNDGDEAKQGDRAVSPKRENTKLIPAPPPATNAWTRKSNLTQELRDDNSSYQKGLEKNAEGKSPPSHIDNSNKTGERKPGRNDDFPKKRDQRYRDDTHGKHGLSDRDSPSGDGIDQKQEDGSRTEKQPKDPMKFEDAKPRDFTSANKFAQLPMEDNVDPGSSSE